VVVIQGVVVVAAAGFLQVVERDHLGVMVLEEQNIAKIIEWAEVEEVHPLTVLLKIVVKQDQAVLALLVQ
jgi:hypothetical protein